MTASPIIPGRYTCRVVIPPSVATSTSPHENRAAKAPPSTTKPATRTLLPGQYGNISDFVKIAQTSKQHGADSEQRPDYQEAKEASH